MKSKYRVTLSVAECVIIEERAKALQAAYRKKTGVHFGWEGFIYQAVTKEESDKIVEFWGQLPGWTCWINAYNCLRKGVDPWGRPLNAEPRVNA